MFINEKYKLCVDFDKMTFLDGNPIVTVLRAVPLPLDRVFD